MEYRGRGARVVLVVGLTALISLFAGACGGDDESTLEVDLEDITETPTHLEDDDVWVVRDESGQAHAFYEISSYGCPLQLLGQPNENFPDAVLWDNCAGAYYDRNGVKLFGPGPPDLDVYAVEQTDSELIIDLEEITCTPAAREPCPTEPRFDD